MQTDYNEKKKSAAERHYFKAVEIDDDQEIVDDDKQAIQNEIFGKMQQMNDMFIDLSEIEIDQIQEILEDGSDDDVRSEGSFEWLPELARESFPVPFTSKLEADDDGQSYVPDDSGPKSVNDVSTGASNPDEITEVGANVNTGDSETNNAIEVATGDLNPDEITDLGANVNTGDSETNIVNEATNATSVEIKSECNANIQNDSGKIPFFSPPSTSSSNAYLSQIPAHFVRLDPNLRDLLSKRATNGNSNDNLNENSNGNSNASKSQMTGGRSQMTLEEILEAVKLLFPGQCTYVSRTRSIS